MLLLSTLVACSSQVTPEAKPPPLDGPLVCWGATAGQYGDFAAPGAIEAPGIDRLIGTAGPICARTAAGLQCLGSSAPGWPDESAVLRRFDLVPDAVTVAFGSGFGCAVRPSGGVSCWGDNLVGQLGNGSAPHPETEVQIRVGADGSLQTGALPPGSTSERPVEVVGLTDVAELVTASSHSCARRTAGPVECWGAGDRGQLGSGVPESSPVPVVVAGLDDAVQLAASQAWTCAVRRSGSVACWGTPDAYPRGGERPTVDPSPRPIEGIQGAVEVALRMESANSSANEGAARMADGTVIRFDGTHPPTPIVGLPPLQGLTAGAHHTCGRTADGQVWCWGSGDRGQLGAQASSGGPAQVPGLSGAIELASGRFATCARR